jgi:hypothetical protein
MFSLSMAAANNKLPVTHVFCECILKEAFILHHCQFDQQHFDMEWSMNLLHFKSVCKLKENISVAFFKYVH